MRRILVVADDPDIGMNVRDILEDLGYAVDLAQDGPQAIELAKQHEYEVGLLDYKMPGMNGVDLYKQLRPIQPQMVAIMITAYAGSEGAQAARDAGTWRVLRKPVDVGALIPLLDKACESPIILVVDDDEDFCDTLWQTLRNRDYRVNLAHNESDAIEKASHSQYDTAVVDLKLNAGDGRNVVEWMQQVRPDAGGVIVTACPAAAEVLDAKVAPNDICYKPIDMDKLLHLIDPNVSP
jgi:DNA-binding NtrC family response regulator